MNNQPKRTRHHALLGLATLMSLVACGGGNDYAHDGAQAEAAEPRQLRHEAGHDNHDDVLDVEFQAQAGIGQ